jgi:hypothetical protein
MLPSNSGILATKAMFVSLLVFLLTALVGSNQIPFVHAEPQTSARNSAYIFSSLHGLMRQNPNTHNPNGFSISAATIPAFTTLFHARKDPGAVPKVEWLAFDSEMSYAIMGGQKGPGTWMHTYTTTRPAKVLIFDGMSAVIRRDGSMDSQMVFIYGTVAAGAPTLNSGDPVWSDGPEYERAEILCAWAKEAGVEGFIRMATGFEMLWCDFGSDALKELSHLEIPSTESVSITGVPWANAAGWEWIRSASWHFEKPELRVIPDYCRFFTFYSPDYKSFPSNLTTDKKLHRLEGVKAEDTDKFKTTIKETMKNDELPCSGLDWRRVSDDVVDRFSARLQELMKANTRDWAKEIAYAVIVPFMGDPNVMERCAWVQKPDNMSPQEVLLRDSVQCVLQKICALFQKVLESERLKWKEEARDMIRWLDWSEWKTCEQCAEEELCVPGPMWPVLGLMDWQEWTGPRCIKRGLVERKP